MLHRINIFQSLYERFPLPEGLPPILVNGKPLPVSNAHGVYGSGRACYSLRLVPDYFQIEKLPPGYELKTVPQDNWGHSIDLTGHPTVDHYMGSQFKSKPRSIIKRYISRLEHCFPIRYRTFLEDMTKDQYDQIFSSLRLMIEVRFVQRKETHMEAWRWESLKEDTYGLIKAGQASFFVIFDGDLPIEISLNYHLNDVLFSSISSFDIDYAKFGLGHVEIYKQLEWCLENGYSRFEMGVGGMDYKIRWSNSIYRFTHLILAPQSSFFPKMIALIEYGRVRVKEYLKAKKINEARDRLFAKLSFPRPRHDMGTTKGFVLHDPGSPLDPSLLLELDLAKLELHEGLKKELNDFLYTNSVSRENIKVYQLMDKLDAYFILNELSQKGTVLHRA